MEVQLHPSYERRKNPFSFFNRKCGHNTLEFGFGEEDDEVFQRKSERFFLSTLYATQNKEERKALLMEEGAWSDLLKFGPSMLNNIDLFAPTDPDKDSETPTCFPFWGLARIKEIETTHEVMSKETEDELTKEHSCLYYTYLTAHYPSCSKKSYCRQCLDYKDLLASPPKACDQLNCVQCEKYKNYKLHGNCGIYNCLICHEYLIWRNLLWWYEEVFMRSFRGADENKKMMQKYILPDGSTIERPARLKSLVVKGPRESGKTKFFQGLCRFLEHRVCLVKNRFHRNLDKKLESAWLLLIEDFTFKENTDLQMLKAIVSGEPTVIEGKWLSLLYQGGIPCVILCNDADFYWYLYDSPDFHSQCQFIDLGDQFWLGPPHFSSPLPDFGLVPNANIQSVIDERVQERYTSSQKRTKKKSMRYCKTGLQNQEPELFASVDLEDLSLLPRKQKHL